MGKVNKTTRVYLTIEVEEPTWNREPGDWATRGRQKADEIKRLLHAFNLNYLENVDWHVVAEDQCSLCGSEWEEDEDGPTCCRAAQVEWKEARNG